MPQGTSVDQIRQVDSDWLEVNTTIAGTALRGFVHARYLGPAGTAFPSALANAGVLPTADLGPSASATRSKAGGRAYAIQEAGQPGNPSTHANGKAAGIRRVIDWLDVGNANHLRWQGGGGKTFCNVYAYDASNICGCYLPRVWWTSKAIAELSNGNPVEAKYGATVDEIRANFIFNWLVEYGDDFGWQRVFDVDDLQRQANSGRIGIVCAQRTDLEKPGHIQLIAPESVQHTAQRNAAGKVVQPLQSNAGSKNFTYGFMPPNWWQGANFKQFGFWTNDVG